MSDAYFKRIERQYGITKEIFLRILADQQSLCAICKRQLVLFSSDRAEVPCVDHKHGGEVRGLLCHTCNIAVGFIEKDRERTEKALAYIISRRGGNKRVRGWASRARKSNMAEKQFAEIKSLLTAQPDDATIDESPSSGVEAASGTAAIEDRNP